MKTVWKFPLLIQSLQAIALPQGAELLTVQVQGSTPRVWARVDTAAPRTLRGILITGTGHSFDDGESASPYLGTFQMQPESLVYHVFDLGER